MITELTEKMSDGEVDEKTVKETTAVAFGGTVPHRACMSNKADTRL